MKLLAAILKTTLTGDTSRQSFNCTGLTDYDLASDFIFWDAADLFVSYFDVDGVETVLTLITDYTVSGGSGANGTVSTVATYTEGTLVIYRDVAYTQVYDGEVGDGFNTDTFEIQLDRNVGMIQQLARKIAGAFRFADSDTTTASPILPSPEAKKAYVWNDDATELILADVDLVAIQALTDEAEGYKDDAAGSASGASGSASAAAGSASAASDSADAAQTAEAGAVAAVADALDNLRSLRVNLPTWDMDATAIVTLQIFAQTGFNSFSKIRHIDVMISADGDTLRVPLYLGGGYEITPIDGAGGVVLTRDAAGYFDNTSYDDGTLDPRGYAIVWYDNS